ncbi:MAG: hypothetical protein ACXWTY_16830 [Methylobacter sp.]
MTADKENEVMGDCLRRFREGWQSTPDHLRGEYIVSMTTIGIGLMRSNLGADFTKGYLNEARADLDNPAQIVFIETTKH